MSGLEQTVNHDWDLNWCRYQIPNNGHWQQRVVSWLPGNGFRLAVGNELAGRPLNRHHLLVRLGVVFDKMLRNAAARESWEHREEESIRPLHGNLVQGTLTAQRQN